MNRILALSLLGGSLPLIALGHGEVDAPCRELLLRQHDLHTLEMARLKMDYEASLEREREQHRHQLTALMRSQGPRLDERRAEPESGGKKEVAHQAEKHTRIPGTLDTFTDVMPVERTESPFPLPAGTGRLLLQAEEEGRPCDKSTVMTLFTLADTGPNNQTHYLTQLLMTSPECAICILSCASLLQTPTHLFDGVRCTNDCMSQNENRCLPTTGLEQAAQLIDKAALHDRDSLISMMAVTEAECTRRMHMHARIAATSLGSP
jgi:hypothetical protein